MREDGLGFDPPLFNVVVGAGVFGSCEFGGVGAAERTEKHTQMNKTKDIIQKKKEGRKRKAKTNINEQRKTHKKFLLPFSASNFFVSLSTISKEPMLVV